MNILQYRTSNFVTETPIPTRATFWCHNPCSIRKKCSVASANKNVSRVAAKLARTDKHLRSNLSSLGCPIE